MQWKYKDFSPVVMKEQGNSSVTWVIQPESKFNSKCKLKKFHLTHISFYWCLDKVECTFFFPACGLYQTHFSQIIIVADWWAGGTFDWQAVPEYHKRENWQDLGGNLSGKTPMPYEKRLLEGEDIWDKKELYSAGNKQTRVSLASHTNESS